MKSVVERDRRTVALCSAVLWVTLLASTPGCSRPERSGLFHVLYFRAMELDREPGPWIRVQQADDLIGAYDWPLWPLNSGWFTLDGELLIFDSYAVTAGTVSLESLHLTWCATPVPEKVDEVLSEGGYRTLSREARKCYASVLASGAHGECSRATATEIVRVEVIRAVASAADRWRPWANVKQQLDAVATFAAQCGLAAEECGDLAKWREAVLRTCELEASLADGWKNRDAAELRILFQVEEFEASTEVGKGQLVREPLFSGYWSHAHVELLRKYWESSALTRAIRRSWGDSVELEVTTVGMRVQALARYLNDGVAVSKEEVPFALRRK